MVRMLCSSFISSFLECSLVACLKITTALEDTSLPSFPLLSLLWGAPALVWLFVSLTHSSGLLLTSSQVLFWWNRLTARLSWLFFALTSGYRELRLPVNTLLEILSFFFILDPSVYSWQISLALGCGRHGWSLSKTQCLVHVCIEARSPLTLVIQST